MNGGNEGISLPLGENGTISRGEGGRLFGVNGAIPDRREKSQEVGFRKLVHLHGYISDGLVQRQRRGHGDGHLETRALLRQVFSITFKYPPSISCDRSENGENSVTAQKRGGIIVVIKYESRRKS